MKHKTRQPVFLQTLLQYKNFRENPGFAKYKARELMRAHDTESNSWHIISGNTKGSASEYAISRRIWVTYAQCPAWYFLLAPIY